MSTMRLDFLHTLDVGDDLGMRQIASRKKLLGDSAGSDDAADGFPGTWCDRHPASCECQNLPLVSVIRVRRPEFRMAISL